MKSFLVESNLKLDSYKNIESKKGWPLITSFIFLPFAVKGSFLASILGYLKTTFVFVGFGLYILDQNGTDFF